MTRPLTFKMFLMVCVAMLAAVLTFWGTKLIGETVVQKVYLTQESIQQRLTEKVDSFRQYVADHQVSSTNVKEIGWWNRAHITVQMTVYGLYTTVNSSANGAELMLNDNGILIRSEDMIDGSVSFPVNFQDGIFTVEMFDHSRGMLEIGVNVGALLLAALVFLIMIIIYNQHVTRLIKTLSRQVQLVSQGDLECKIAPMSRDEIGQLALDVDAMRLSIIDKLEREKAAFQANTQLITAISHDVRTPLTALMGYLEILSDETLSSEERQAYLTICKNNAQRLKGLTDELFGFFLVFGKPTPDQVLEEFDAVTLLEQILLEHEMNLNQHHFEIQSHESGDFAGKLKVDLGHLRRIFDNLFSNILKYADPSQPVSLEKRAEHDVVHIIIQNGIPAQSNRVESNRIGLQTCQKLVEAMGGTFRQTRTANTFSAEVILPLIRESGDNSTE